MEPIILNLFSEGDSYLKEAKSMFFTKKEEQHSASCYSCKAIKKYLEAYEEFLFDHVYPTENYHVLLHAIIQEDSDFKKFSEKIYEVKCFAEESNRLQNEFFLFAEEINDVLSIVSELREYIASKIDLSAELIEMYSETSFMTT